MHVRTEIANALEAALPDTWTVLDSAQRVDDIEPDQVIVVVYTAAVRPGPALGLRANEVHLWLLDGQQEAGDVDDALDDNLDVLLAQLDRLPLLEWTDAERLLFLDRFHAYKVTTNVNTSKE